MDIEIPTEILDMVKLIAQRGDSSVDEAINRAIRFFIMIHYMPYEDQVELNSIVSKTYDDVKLKGLH